MDRTMVVGAYEHQIVHCIVSSAAEPLDVMSFAERFSVLIHRIPAANLAAPIVHLLQSVHESPISFGHGAGDGALSF
jgi:hypothetical protein